MKKLLLILTIVIFQITAIFAYYTPTQQDQTLLDTVKTRLEKILKPEGAKNLPLANAVNNLKEKYKSHERMSYILNELEFFIRNYGQDTEIEDLNPCNKTLQELTSKFQKQTFYVSSEQEIRNVLTEAKTRTNSDLYYEIVIAEGTYTLSNGFRVDSNKIIFRGATENADDVKLQGNGMNGNISHIFRVLGDDIMIGDLTLRNVANHAIQIMGEKDADFTTMHNIKIFDIGEQMIKGSYNQDTLERSNNGLIQCSKFYYSAGFGPQYYIGGIDIHYGKDRIVRHNTFRNITSPETKLAEHAIHFRSNSENIIIEHNTIINCDRGIGFGLGSKGHDGGIIRYNAIYHNYQKGDVGIGLESAKNITVHNNTIYFENDYANAIEYRFNISTNNKIFNNSTNKNIKSRDNGHAEVYDNNTNLNNYNGPK